MIEVIRCAFYDIDGKQNIWQVTPSFKTGTIYSDKTTTFKNVEVSDVIGIMFKMLLNSEYGLKQKSKPNILIRLTNNGVPTDIIIKDNEHYIQYFDGVKLGINARNLLNLLAEEGYYDNI